MEIKYNKLLDIEKTIAKELFENANHPWEVLDKINEYILKVGPTLGYTEIKENVWVGSNVTISETSTINGPAIIGDNTEIRHAAFIRGNAIIGNNCVIGNSTEIKNAILFDNCECPHFNYIGDAILGYKAHTGAGVILSNVKNDKKNIKISNIDTGLRKLSAIVGNNVEIGCNSVLCPGTIIYENTSIYPLTRVRGIIEDNMIVKDMNNIIKKN